ncbi:hypothetical protein [Mesorhizobium sp. Root157]|uniref:hypothetical protein n=1 Tax=Mesorhizobium sp. Root157 TaxID=1736477 RepID=UPI000AD29BEA|nr:hypothetical protein [Mesorhizobium sp. Root157]
MSAGAAMQPPRAGRSGRKLALWGLIAAGVLLLVAANVHLVYVAVTSQPDCVPHAREVGVDGAPLRAARSAC